MKRGTLLLTLLGGLMANFIYAQEAKENLHLFEDGQLANIYIDKQLYESDESDYFFVRFIIKNKSGKRVGLGINEDWNIIYANQCVMYVKDRDKEALEYQITPYQLDKPTQDKLYYDYKYNELKMLEKDDEVEYFCEYTGMKKKDLQKMKPEEKLTISFDGQLFLTDGEVFEDVNCYDENQVNRTFTLQYPLAWSRMPTIKDIRIIKSEKQ